MSLAAVAIAVLGLGSPSQTLTRHYATHGWLIDVRQDRFTGAISCSLHKGFARYTHGALVFRFGQEVDTAGAVYRVDDGPAKSARADVLQLEEAGVPMNQGPIANPSGGEVAMPTADLQSARQVLVRPSRNAQPRRFDVSGLSEALAGASNAGCKPDRSF